MKSIYLFFLVLLLQIFLLEACLITNCPRGGKRNGGKIERIGPNVKQCISCGPGRSGQCFGPNICCGPFGCLIGTSESLKCQREGFFHDSEPCLAGNSSCRRNTGRCASDGICCNQEGCHSDPTCSINEKNRPPFLDTNVMPMDIYSLLNYQLESNDSN